MKGLTFGELLRKMLTVPTHHWDKPLTVDDACHVVDLAIEDDRANLAVAFDPFLAEKANKK